jgi:hypothetical protein
VRGVCVGAFTADICCSYFLLIFTTGTCEDIASVRPLSRAADLKHASPLTKALTKAL